MSIYDFLLGKKKDPIKESRPYFDKAEAGYLPFQNVSQDLVNDPGGYLERLMGGYKQSQGYQRVRDDALNAALSTAAAGGKVGTREDIMNQAGIADRLARDDMQQYLQNVSGLLGTGLQQGLSGANALSGIYGTQGGMAAQQAQEANKQRGQLLGTLGGLAGAGIGAYLGGAPGASIGYNLGSGGTGYKLDPNDFVMPNKTQGGV